MKILSQRVLMLVLISFTVLSFVQCAKPQTGPAAVVVERPHPAWQGKAGGDIRLFEHANEDWKKAILSQEAPDVWLGFDSTLREDQSSGVSGPGSELVIKVALSTQAKDILKSFWQETLRYSYDQDFVKAKSAQEQFDRDAGWLRTYLRSADNLEKLEISAPDGTRLISSYEAKSLLDFAKNEALRLVRLAKDQ